MPPEDRIRLEHMLEAATKARSLAKGRERDHLVQDEPFLMALIKYLEIIGEAAAKTTDETQRANPAIPWRQIVGMRNRLIHVYFDVNIYLVWRTVDEDLPPIIAEIERTLAVEG